jgi:hypothetical protein
VLWGASVAAGLATIAIVPTVAGISTWKWVLGFLGIVLFALAERQARV